MFNSKMLFSQNESNHSLGITAFIIYNIPIPSVTYANTIKILNLNNENSFSLGSEISLIPLYPIILGIDYIPLKYEYSYGYACGNQSKKKFGIYTSIGFEYFISTAEGFYGFNSRVGMRKKHMDIHISYLIDKKYPLNGIMSICYAYMFYKKERKNI